jgi:radical SAM protein with 4Fe4S-binding SPASM domain
MFSFLHDNIRIVPFLLKNYRSNGPRLIDIELTHKCNLNCIMCWLHGAKGEGDKYKGSELSISEIIKLLDQVSKYRPNIYLGGSEPLIRKDLLQILSKIRDLDLYVFFTSNGTLLDSEKNRKMVELGVDHIIFSIDGDEDLHDRLRGKGVFQKVTWNIRELVRHKKELLSLKPQISVNILLTPFIIGRLAKTLDAIDKATEGGVDVYRIHHLWYITGMECKQHQLEVKKYLKCSAHGAVCHMNVMEYNINTRLFHEELNEVKERVKICQYPDMDYNQMLDYYSEGTINGRRCWAPFYKVLIKPNGDVTFCPDEWINDYILGNIRTERFDDIWNNEKAMRFRSIVYRRKSFPGCKRCSWMYSF